MNPYWLLVIPAVLALWWMEWGKVFCKMSINGFDVYTLEQTRLFSRLAEHIFTEKCKCGLGRHCVITCTTCHGTGRVRRGWISGLIKGRK
jgi:hypothetical protein